MLYKIYISYMYEFYLLSMYIYNNYNKMSYKISSAKMGIL